MHQLEEIMLITVHGKWTNNQNVTVSGNNTVYCGSNLFWDNGFLKITGIGNQVHNLHEH